MLTKGLDKDTKDRLQEMKERAGDKVLYSIDVISLVETIYTADSDIYKAMVNGEQISALVKATIRTDKDSVTGTMKARLYNLCVKYESTFSVEQDN